MILLSNIFRSRNTSVKESSKREIGIRSFGTAEDQSSEKVLSLNDVLVERSKLIDDANKKIEIEKGILDDMRQTATDDIKVMRQVWEQEKIELQKQAYEEGFQIGYEEGRNKVTSDMTSAIQQANEATVTSHENALNYQNGQERVILEIAMRSASRIVGETIEHDDEKFLSVVRRAVKETREMKEIKLYVSLDYFDLISKNRAELASIFPPDVPFLIFVNEDFEATECYIETNHGRIVVSIDEQLNILREQLIEILESGD